MHQTIKKVGADIETLKMNTAIAQLMTLVNALYDNGGATKAEFETVVQLLNPFAPHMTEELWEKLGHSHDEQLAYYPCPSMRRPSASSPPWRSPCRSTARSKPV